MHTFRYHDKQVLIFHVAKGGQSLRAVTSAVCSPVRVKYKAMYIIDKAVLLCFKTISDIISIMVHKYYIVFVVIFR